MAATVVVSAVLAAFLVSQATAQPPEPADPLERYDANDNGVIDADEVIQATADYLNGLIDGALAYRVWLLYTSTLVTGQGWTEPCNDYDEDDSGVIEKDEVLDAIDDYLYEEVIDKATVLAVINCYYSGTHSIAISGLPNSLQSGGSHAFTVTASNLLTSNSYTIKVTTNHSSIGFDVGCSTRTKDYAVTVDADNSNYSSRLTLYACSTPGGKVFARLVMGDDIGELVSASQSVTVTASTTPPPDLPPTPVPTATPTPSLPSVGIVLDSSGTATVTEGTPVRLKLIADPTPKAPLTVKIEVSENGSFIDREFYPDGEPPSEIIILKDATSARLVLVTDDDDIDEADGTITAVVIPGAGYNVADPPRDRKSVTVEDNDLPKPPGPDISRPISVSDHSATVRWSHRSGVAEYLFQYRRANGIGWRSVNVKVSPPEGIAYLATITGLKCETRHRFRVRAWGDGVTYRRAWGPFSDVAYATTDACVDVPPAPTPTPTPTTAPGEYAALVEPPPTAPDCRSNPWRLQYRKSHPGPRLISADGRHEVQVVLYTTTQWYDLNLSCIEARFVSESTPGADSISWSGKLYKTERKLNLEGLSPGQIGLMDVIQFLGLYEDQPLTDDTPAFPEISRSCETCRGGTIQTRHEIVNTKLLKIPTIYARGEHIFAVGGVAGKIATDLDWMMPIAVPPYSCAVAPDPDKCSLRWYGTTATEEVSEDVDAGLLDDLVNLLNLLAEWYSGTQGD